MGSEQRSNEGKVISLIDRLAARYVASLDTEVVSFDVNKQVQNTILRIPKWEWEYSRKQRRLETQRELYLREELLRADYTSCKVCLSRTDRGASHGKLQFCYPWEHDGTLYKLSLEKKGGLTLNSEHYLVSMIFTRIFNKLRDKPDMALYD